MPKYCPDCRHYKNPWESIRYHCAHPNNYRRVETFEGPMLQRIFKPWELNGDNNCTWYELKSIYPSLGQLISNCWNGLWDSIFWRKERNG